MPHDVQIRPTQLADLPSLVTCLNAVFEERRFLAFTAAIPAPEAIAYHAANITSGHPHFVAVDGNVVVGLCDVVPAAMPRIEGQRHCATLGMLLAPAYRGQGIGERLIRAALAACSGRWDRIQLNVYSHNERAHALYRKVGFVEEGRRVGAWQLDGLTSDIIDMVYRTR
ncbi:MAG: GNAT family N-acetyltransferase [Burkholderiales bacterium]|nr:GNAT family N-acetyltransferase [Burkholderiales bacterium]